MRARPPSLGQIARYGVSLAILGWLAWQARSAPWDQLGALDARWSALAVLLAGLAYPLQAWRWQILLRVQGSLLATGTIHRVFWIGTFFNAILPGGVAGDAARFAYLWRADPGEKAAHTAGLMMDRLLGFLTLLLLAAAALAVIATDEPASTPARQLLTISAAAVAALVFAAAVAFSPGLWPAFLTRRLGEARTVAWSNAIGRMRGAPGAIAQAAGLSVLVWVADFASLALLGRAVGLDAPFLSVCIAAAAAYLSASVPITIGGHGLREAAYVGTLALFLPVVGREQLALLALAFWAVTVLWSTVGGAVYLASPGLADSSAGASATSSRR